MLLFRDEEHVNRWCHQWGRPVGAVLSLGTTWQLAHAWYKTRLQPDWQRRSIEEAHTLFTELGLSSDFWRFQ